MKFGLEHMENYTAQKSENSTVKQKESLFTLKKKYTVFNRQENAFN